MSFYIFRIYSCILWSNGCLYQKSKHRMFFLNFAFLYSTLFIYVPRIFSFCLLNINNFSLDSLCFPLSLFVNSSVLYLIRTYIYIYIYTKCISQTQHNCIIFIILLGQLDSILIESSSGPSIKQILTQQCLKCAVGSQTLAFFIYKYVQNACVFVFSLYNLDSLCASIIQTAEDWHQSG